MNFTIMTGDNRETLKTLADNSVDAIITDPPYGIDFLGKSWDANTGAIETYTECLRVLKPGGHILAFSAARTYHHLAITLEQAGFEIRDQIMWLYASGFPKAHDIGKMIQKRQGVEQTKEYKHNVPVNGGAGDTKHYTNTSETVCTSPLAQQWSGWKTQLKPAHEPICMARKPFKGSTLDNVLTHGLGALNIDATRIATDESITGARASMQTGAPHFQGTNTNTDNNEVVWKQNEGGRFPSNVLGEIDGYQKFFYCPKVSRKERHVGFEQTDIPTNPDGMYSKNDDGSYKNPGKSYIQTAEKQRTQANNAAGKIQTGLTDKNGNVQTFTSDPATHSHGNNHPTVKPIELMKYLINLVTPPNSVVLDPFNGSGSTGMAAVELGHTYIGCELDPAYVDIATKRITAWNTPDSTSTFEDLFE